VKCRHCKSSLEFTLIDLGSAPPSNAYLTDITLRRPEKHFPLRVMVCEHCWLVQAEDYSRAAELFNDEYAYFSSFSVGWLEHSERYVLKMIEKFNLSRNSFVVEVASNDGYLLQYFQQRSVPCLGIEPTSSTANAARAKGIETLEKFFGVKLAEDLILRGNKASLIIANNVLAHVPDINDFVSGFEILLAEDGIATFEFPHLLNMISEHQFDTIYHEHFSYLSLSTVKEIFEKCGLEIFDVEEISTHGGSLRVYAQKEKTGIHSVEASVKRLVEIEKHSGLRNRDFYQSFKHSAELVKHDLLRFLLDAKKQNKKTVGYGAAAKGNTLLNYAGVGKDLIELIVDRNPSKQGKFMPGSRIPILNEGVLAEIKPDYILVLPWNLIGEITEQLSYTKEWGCKIVTAQPRLTLYQQ